MLRSGWSIGHRLKNGLLRAFFLQSAGYGHAEGAGIGQIFFLRVEVALHRIGHHFHLHVGKGFGEHLGGFADQP